MTDPILEQREVIMAASYSTDSKVGNPLIGLVATSDYLIYISYASEL